MSEPAGKVVVVGPADWRDVCRTIRGRHTRLIWRVLQHMHDLHVGITPRLATELTQVLTATSPDQYPHRSVWFKVHDRLCKVFAEETLDIESRERRAGLVPSQAPYYYVARIATPLVAGALRRLGTTVLFSAADEPPIPEFPPTYQEYDRQLERLLEARLRGKLSDIFWFDRAFALNRLSRPRPPAGLPVGDVCDLAMLQRLEPEPKERPPRRRSRPQVASRTPAATHRKEGGVDGIHLTRRLADLPGLLSEYVHPRLVRLERLLVTGFLAVDRPPREEKRRDLLVVGLMPPEPFFYGPRPRGGRQLEIGRALVKAAWIDAMARLAEVLERQGLRRSELIWIQGDALGRWHALRCLLWPLADRGGLPVEKDETRRRTFLLRVGWMPELVDRHAAARIPVSLEGPAGRDGASGRPEVIRWTRAVLGRLEDDPAWQELGEPRTRKKHGLPYDAYKSVHMMLTLPAAWRPVRDMRLATDKSEKEATPRLDDNVGVYRRHLGLPPVRGTSLTITWMPERLQKIGHPDGWAVSVPGRPTRRVFEAVDSLEGFEDELATRLADTWLDELRKEMVRD